MKTEALDVFKIFEKAHGEDQAKKIISYLENTDTVSLQKEVAQKTSMLATKEDIFELQISTKKDISELKEDISVVKKDISVVKEDISVVKKDISALREDISELRISTKEDISDLKVLIEKSAKDHFKWMFAFFIPLYLTLLGFILVNLSRMF